MSQLHMGDTETLQQELAPGLSDRTYVRRRGSLQQGFALEALGHAVEYLIDSRLFLIGENDARTEQEAIQLLMRLSRAVFLECPEVESMRLKMSRWLGSGLRRWKPLTDGSVPQP